VGIFVPVLTSSDTLAPAYRWRLVDSLILQVRPPIEGSLAVAIVAVVGWARSGNMMFASILALCVGVMLVRIANFLHYRRHVQGGRRRGDTPDRFAWHFMLLSLVAGSLWGCLNVAALASGDPMLQMFTLVVQSGWLGTASTRNAASPATVVWQGVVVLAPTAVCLFLSGNHFLYTILPFGAIQFGATIGVAHTIGAQMVAALLSEQGLEAANARLTKLSSTDGLTGIANRRAFDATLAAEWGRAARDGTDLGLLIIDVDHFKMFNDRYGHPAGDDCLRLIARLAGRALRRPPDIVARFGGEEFAAILPGTSLAGALEVGERVRQAIMQAGLAHEASGFGCVTVSVGSASLSPHPGTDPQALIDIADRALYAAKHAGRNQVVSGGPMLGRWTGGDADVYCAFTSSTSNSSVAPGGMTPGAPRSP
jgi:diguanylate cyclase (GGDEF)-like protein